MPKPVLLLHGIWMHAAFLKPLQRNLQKQGLEVIPFSYPSMRQTLAQNAIALQQQLDELDIDSCDFIGHSLGGLVIGEFLQKQNDFPPCRVVALGTPFRGSSVARRLDHSRISRWMIGAQSNSRLTEGMVTWPRRHELGVIAGSLALGAGQLVKRFGEPNDGTVAVAETRIEGMTAHETVQVSHFGMLYSPRVAAMSGCFIRKGSFTPSFD